MENSIIYAELTILKLQSCNSVSNFDFHKYMYIHGYKHMKTKNVNINFTPCQVYNVYWFTFIYLFAWILLGNWQFISCKCELV